MSDAQTWVQVLSIIKRYERPFIIVSATARTTRELLSAAETALNNLKKAHGIADNIKQRHINLVETFLDDYPDKKDPIFDDCLTWINSLTEELKSHLSTINQNQDLTDQQKDMIASFGERLSSYLFVECAIASDVPAKWIDAADTIRTNSDFGQASPDFDFIKSQHTTLNQLVENGSIPVMGGFYGSNEHGQITTLGVEGSDYTASLIGGALDADAIEIWTDVSGIYTCDPRFISDAKPIPQLSFQQATELAYFGAKVLHPATTKPASERDIPIHVKNIFEPEKPGTRISHKSTNDQAVKAITYKENCTIITVTSAQTVMGYRFLAEVFDILRWHHLAVDVVTTTEASVSIAIEDGTKIDEAVEQLQAHGTVARQTDQGIISLVGCSNDNLVAEVLAEVKEIPLNLVSYSKSKGNLNIVVDGTDTLSAVKLLHRKLFESDV